MRIVEPWIKVEKFDGIEIMKKIEKACRTCYRSEGMVSEESYKNLLKKLPLKGSLVLNCTPLEVLLSLRGFLMFSFYVL